MVAQVQDTICGTKGPAELPLSLGKGSAYVDLSLLDTVSIPLAIHIVRLDDGTQGVDESQFPVMIGNLNSAFAPAKMKFFIYSKDTISSTYWANDLVGTPESQDSLSELNSRPNAINVYFKLKAIFGGAATFTPDIAALVERYVQSVILTNLVVNSSVVPHEMGHYFNLFHAFENSINPPTCPDNSNWSTSGDLVQDTPPEPSTIPNKGLSNFDENCHYVGPDSGQCGPLTQAYFKDLLNQIGAHNFMTYVTNLSCRNTFTTEQVRRIRTTLQTKRSELIRRWVQFTNIVSAANAGGTFLIDNSIVVPSGGFYGATDSLQH
jgi:hypothetical protein